MDCLGRFFIISLLLHAASANWIELIHLGDPSDSNLGKNFWPGWYDSNTFNQDTITKHSAYYDLPITQLKFTVDNGAATAITIPFAQTNLRQLIADAGISASSTNDGSSQWTNGHMTLNFESRTSSTYFPSSKLYIGLGDGSSDSQDWFLFGFDFASAVSYDHAGSDYKNIGGEFEMSNTGWTEIRIFGWSPPPPTSGWVELIHLGDPSDSNLGKNSWPGWYDSNTFNQDTITKHSAYYNLPITQLKFTVDNGAATAITIPFAQTNLRQLIADAGMSASSANDGSSQWTNGHMTIDFESKTSSTYFPSSELYIGLGDGSSDSQDWCLFGFDFASAVSWDHAGNDYKNIGGEYEMSNTGWTEIRIYGLSAAGSNCVLGAPLNPSVECSFKCESLTQNITTPATGSGTCSPATHQCVDGEGSCGVTDCTIAANSTSAVDEVWDELKCLCDEYKATGWLHEDREQLTPTLQALIVLLKDAPSSTGISPNKKFLKRWNRYLGRAYVMTHDIQHNKAIDRRIWRKGCRQILVVDDDLEKWADKFD